MKKKKKQERDKGLDLSHVSTFGANFSWGFYQIIYTKQMSKREMKNSNKLKKIPLVIKCRRKKILTHAVIAIKDGLNEPIKIILILKNILWTRYDRHFIGK